MGPEWGREGRMRRGAYGLECPIYAGCDQGGDAVRFVVDQADVHLATGEACLDGTPINVALEARGSATEGGHPDVCHELRRVSPN